MELEFIQPGKPVQNTFIERFNDTFSDECLNENWFIRLEDARLIIEDWRGDYNDVRQHTGGVRGPRCGSSPAFRYAPGMRSAAARGRPLTKPEQQNKGIPETENLSP